MAAIAVAASLSPTAAQIAGDRRGPDATDRFEFNASGIFGGVGDPDDAPTDQARGSGPAPATGSGALDHLFGAPDSAADGNGRPTRQGGAVVVPGAVATLARPEISWRVENPFRFFTDPEDTARHQKALAALTPEERRAPVLSAERRLAAETRYGWADELKGAVCWDTERNLHRCPNGGDYVNPTAHIVVAQVDGLPDAATVRCHWRVVGGGKSRRDQRQPARRVTAPCNEPARLSIPYPTGAEITVSVGGRAIATAHAKVEDLLIVGVGDSFGSGEGNPDRPVRFDRERTADYGAVRKDLSLAGFPARVGAWRRLGDDRFQRQNAQWLDQACHRSLYSHQLRAALQLAIESPHRAVTFLHFACSGAEIVRGLFLRYKGNEWTPTPPEFSQISAIARAQCGPRKTREQRLPEAYHMRGRVPDLQGHLVLHECDRRRSRKIDLMFVSIGGNDIGFSRLVANAVLNEESVLKRLGGWFGQLHDSRIALTQLGELEHRYRAFNRALHYILHIPWSESDRVILTAYPALALLDDGQTTCPSGRAGMDLLPAFHLSRARAADSQAAADRLDEMMRKVSRRHGWSYADAHRDAFIGRGVCAGYVDNALSSADDLRFPRRVNGQWVPYNPADYRPYASRQRWFRTPNDAYLTGHFHVAGSLLQKFLRNRDLYWTQVLLAATYSGAFHPTAEGHAAIADAVVRTARRVLERHSGGNRIK